MLPRRLLGACVLAVLAGLLLAPAAPARPEEPHRALRAALYHLREAREELKDKRLDRHRKRLERDLSVAIRELERALKEGRVESKYEPAKDWHKGYKDFRHLRRALAELDEARKGLRNERGEWARRKELLAAIDDARAHVQDALRDLR
jgi:hypothetical protein